VNGPEILTDIKHQFAGAIGAWDAPPFEPLAISPWLGAALLQKNIRRGEENFALRAAATLLQISPDRMWRRCTGISFGILLSLVLAVRFSAIICDISATQILNLTPAQNMNEIFLCIRVDLLRCPPPWARPPRLGPLASPAASLYVTPG
jgi:hypothetical protein